MTHRGSKQALERRSGIRVDKKTSSDGATSCSIEAFQFGDIGNA